MKKFFGRNKQYEEDLEWEELDAAVEGETEYYEEDPDTAEVLDDEEIFEEEVSEAEFIAEEFIEDTGYEGEEFYEETAELPEEEVYADENYEALAEEEYVEEVYEASAEEEYVEEVYEASAEEEYVEEGYEASAEEEYVEEGYEASAEEYTEDLFEEDGVYYEEEEEEILAWSAMPDKNIFQKIWYSMIHMSTMDRVITTTGVLVLVLALAAGAVFAGTRMSSKEAASFDTVGTQLNGITVIGEHGLTAVADAELAKQQAANAIEEEEEEEEEVNEYEENEYIREVEVVLNMTSIEKDLKLKFVNGKTKKLIANVPFSVTVKTPDGKTETWTDDDMDGIIYKSGITPGDYTVTMNALTDSKYAGYTMSTSSKKVTVISEIQYKKVDVSDEIKDESELEQKEDVEVELEVESELVDTVVWVESTVTPGKVVWTEVPRADVKVDVSVSASARGTTMKMAAENPAQRMPVRIELLAAREIATITEPSPSTPPVDTEPSASEQPSTSETPSTSPEQSTSPEPSASEQPSISPEPSPSVEPSATPSPSEKEDDTVTEVTLSSTTLSLAVGAKAVLTAAVKPESAADKTVLTWESSNTAVVTVQDGEVTAVAAGTAKITVTAGDKTAECTVTVTELSITLAPTSLNVLAGSSADITAAANGVNGSITAASSDSSIAVVSVGTPAAADGKTTVTLTVTGKSAGTAKITVTYEEGGAKKSADVSVQVLATDKKLVDKNGDQLWKKVSEDNYVEATYSDYANTAIQSFYIKTESEPRYTGWQNIGGKTYYFDANGKKVTGEQVIQGAKYNFASDGSLVVGNGTFGIDVSKWNGNIDWNAVKNSGVSYVIIRCGYRGYGSGALVVDPYFEKNIKGATAAGIKVGIYFFSQAVNRAEAVEEASMVLQLVKGYTISYPIFLDVEYSGAAGNTGRADNLDVATRTEVIKAFCETIQNSGYTAGVYANKSWLTSKIDTNQLTKYKIWLAQYAAAPSYTGRFDLWQYKSTGRITGINGDVDLNLSYLGY